MKGNFKCDCGRKFDIVPQGKGGTITFKSSTPYAGPVSPPAPSPIAAPKIAGAKEWDLVVPFGVAAVTGALLALFMLVAGATLKWATGSGICLTSLVWCVVVLFFFGARYGSIQVALWALEDFFNKDIDGDGHEGEPQEPGRIVINGQPQRPRRWKNLDAGIRREDLVAFARRVYELQDAGMGTGQRAFRKMGLPSRFKCNDKIHAALVRDLVDVGLAYYSGSGFALAQFDDVAALLREVRSRVTVAR